MITKALELDKMFSLNYHEFKLYSTISLRKLLKQLHTQEKYIMDLGIKLQASKKQFEREYLKVLIVEHLKERDKIDEIGSILFDVVFRKPDENLLLN